MDASGDFLFNKNMLPVRVAGVPPDYFSPQGNYGETLYSIGNTLSKAICMVD